VTNKIGQLQEHPAVVGVPSYQTGFGNHFATEVRPGARSIYTS
jgi:hypothetical protein